MKLQHQFGEYRTNITNNLYDDPERLKKVHLFICLDLLRLRAKQIHQIILEEAYQHDRPKDF